MRIDWDTPVDVLMHGDNIRHIDLDEDEIMHWKYIKRERLPSGKYRYYYHDDDYKKAKANLEQANREWDYAKKNRDDIVKKNNAIIEEINKSHNDKYGDKAGSDEHWHEFFDKANPYIEEKRKAKDRVTDAIKKTIDAGYAYSVARATYEKSAGHKVADFLNKASDAVDKAKSWIKSLFGG